MKRLLIGSMLLTCGFATQAQTTRESTLDVVMKQRVLGAWMPGDYKPFSFLRPDGAYKGIDIDLANSLATAMGAKVEIVKTNWANLLPDFTLAKCDIAVGGISISLERQKKRSSAPATWSTARRRSRAVKTWPGFKALPTSIRPACA